MNLTFNTSITKVEAHNFLQKLAQTEILSITISFPPRDIDQEENILAYLIKESRAKHLILSRNRVSFMRENHLRYLRDALKASSYIHSVSLQNNYIGSVFSYSNINMISLALDSANIQCLDLSHNFLLSNFVNIINFLKAIKNSKITNLNLSENAFNYHRKHTRENYINLTIAFNETNITTLIFRNNNVYNQGEDQWKYFCLMLVNSKFTSLDLSANHLRNLEPWQWVYLGNAIRASKIRHLNLSNNDLGHLVESQVIGFSSFLKKVRLLSLNISNNDLYLLTSSCWENIGNAISDIYSLDLSSNNLGEMIAVKWHAFKKYMNNAYVVELNLSNNNLFQLPRALYPQLFDLLYSGKMMQVNLNGNYIAQRELKLSTEVVVLFNNSNNRPVQYYYGYNIATIARLCSNLDCMLTNKRTSFQSIKYDIDDFISFFLKIFLHKKFEPDVLDYHILPYLNLDDELFSVPISSNSRLMLAMSILYENNPVLHHLNFTDPELLFDNKTVVARYIHDENFSLTTKYCNNSTDLNSLLTKYNLPILHHIVKYNYALSHIWELLVRGADPFKEYIDKEYKQVSALSVAVDNNHNSIINFFLAFRSFIHQITNNIQGEDASLSQRIKSFLDGNGINCSEEKLKIYETSLQKHYQTEKKSTVAKFRSKILQSRENREEQLAI